MGEVIIGMPGPWAEDYREKADHYTTKIGGLPDWTIPEMSMDPDLLKCGACGGRLCLIAQVYAPISSPELLIEERAIYVLGCTMPKCGSTPKSWRVLRVQKCHAEMSQESTSPEAMTPKECSTPSKISNTREDSSSMNAEEENNESDSDSDVDLEELGRAFSEASSLIFSSRKHNVTTRFEARGKGPVVKPMVTDAKIPVVPCFYIWSEKERPMDDIGVTCAKYSSLSVKDCESERKVQHSARGSRHHWVLGRERSSDIEDQEEWAHESYEYDKALGADRTYLKFKKRIDERPGQCFRYSFGGSPLLATTELVKPDTCRACGSLRHFEMQLMPPLLYFLHQAADGSTPEQWSWLTLIVYTCSRNCCPLRCKENSSSCDWTVAEEAIIIQEE